MLFRKHLTLSLFVLPFMIILSSCDIPDDEDDGDGSGDDDETPPVASIYCTDLMNAKLNPIGRYQWHLHNYGNEAFATPFTDEQKTAAIGQDINAYTVLKDYCLSGKGVYVGVVDSGMQIGHPSLSPNIDNRANESVTWSVNYRNNRLLPNDPSPIDSDEWDHGTMVSGIIAMRSNLGFGGSGVAPHANLAAYNVISDDAQSFKNFYDSLGGANSSKNNDIFNMSYGTNNTSQMSLDEPIEMASLAMYKSGTRLLRNGKGAIYVKAAGNGFSRLGSWYDYTSCRAAVKYKVSCQDSNMSPDDSMPEVITVGALNVFGKKASYSTTGSSLWISAPGGEYGVDKTWVEAQFERFGKTKKWTTYPATLGEPAIVSTDMLGSAIGNAHKVNMDDLTEVFDIRNSFNAGIVPENENHNYTNTMNGTSSATPVTAGAIAVILEANPKLTWRDVKYVLARTATKVDPKFEGVTADLPKGPFQLEQGWITNAAGYHFSNWYGFGRVNLKAAVDLARNYNYPLGEYIEQELWPKENALDLDVPAGDYTGLTQVIEIPSNQDVVIESVQISISLASKYVGDASIELTSPSGTKSIVWHAANGFADNGNLDKMLIQTNAFYGEKSAGEWTARVINTGIHNESLKWTSFQLRVTGYEGEQS